MRTFIAVEIGDEARETLGRYLEELQRQVPGVRWSKAGNVHVTLRFLGEVADTLIPAVAAAAREAACRAAPFSLSLGKPASFGGRSPRVFLLQITGDVEALAALQCRLEDQLEGAGFGREGRAFKPHATLGRRRKGPVSVTWQDVALTGVTAWDVNELVVLSSTLTPGGPIYVPLARCPLGDQDRPPAEPKREL